VRGGCGRWISSASTGCPRRPSGTRRRKASCRRQGAPGTATGSTRRCTLGPCARRSWRSYRRTATGPRRTMMRAVNAGDVDAALTLLDESHAQLLRDREPLTSVDAALRELASSQAGRPSPRGVVFIGRLARLLRVGPATLRKWERAGLIKPRRDPKTGYRVYGAEDVRDARLAHQLRHGGYLLRQIAPLIERVRHAGGVGPLEAGVCPVLCPNRRRFWRPRRVQVRRSSSRRWLPRGSR